MKSNFFKSAVIAAALFASIGAAQAQAYANASVVTGPSTTMDISSARYADVTPGAQTITDERGTVHQVQLVNPTAVTGSEAYKGYAQLTAYKAINLQAAYSVKCINSSTVIDWRVGGSEVIADGCALQSRIHTLSRR